MHKAYIFIIFCLSFQPSYGYSIDQQIKYTSSFTDSELIGEDIKLNNVIYRLNTSSVYENYSAELHYQVISLNSNQTITTTDIDKTRLFDLTDSFSSTDNQYNYHRLDRFVISHQTDQFVTRFGRQAVSWGNGFVFNNIDIFNPFSPTAIDKEYKSGDDMLYSQFVTESGNDWQLIHLPRRDLTGIISRDVSSTAFKYHHTLSSGEIDLLFAQHYDSSVIGIGINKNIADSIWRIDITSSTTANGGHISSLSTNLDYSWQGFGKNIYAFIELYYNGFGMHNTTDTPNNLLLTKIERGELFTLYRQYLATGLRIELQPLINISPTLISNLTDQSSLLSISINYNWQQNLTATANFILADGNSDTEFASASANTNTAQLYLTYYF